MIGMKKDPKKKDLQDWLTIQCERCELRDSEDGWICTVLGEEFDTFCRNTDGEICRYYY